MNIYKNLLILFFLIFFIKCTNLNDQTKEKKQKTQDTTSVKNNLNDYEIIEIYQELILRSKNYNKSNTNLKGNITLRKYSSELLYNFIKARYGEDNRKNFYELNEQYKKYTQKVGALIDKRYITKSSNGRFYNIVPRFVTFQQSLKLCETRNEKFLDEPVVVECTAFAIGNFTIATAGHCIKNTIDLNRFYFVYGFIRDSRYNTIQKIKSEDIYELKQIIEKKVTNESDFALIKVNKKIPSEKVCKYRDKGKINDREEIFMIGFPNGLPLKLTDHARVLKNNDNNFFTTNLDAYEGNSGSPVFNSKDPEIVEGIFSKGNKDYRNSLILTNNCKVLIKCPEEIGKECIGELVSRTSQFWYLKSRIR